MSWKQPIDTDLIDNPNFNALDRSVWYEIITKCRNSDGLLSFYHGNKRFTVSLKRGQMIFKVRQFARELDIGTKKINSSLKNLSKWYHELHHVNMPYGIIITVLEYDSIVSMDHEVDTSGVTKGSRRDHEGRTSNKSVENVKNDKNDKKGDTPPPEKKEKFLDFIFLDPEELEKLKAELGQHLSEYMDRLNGYIGSTGKKYKSHYFTILNWWRKDKANPRPQKKEWFGKRESVTEGQYLPTIDELELGNNAHASTYAHLKQKLINQKSIPALTDPEQAMARAEIQERQSSY